MGDRRVRCFAEDVGKVGGDETRLISRPLKSFHAHLVDEAAKRLKAHGMEDSRQQHQHWRERLDAWLCSLLGHTGYAGCVEEFREGVLVARLTCQ